MQPQNLVYVNTFFQNFKLSRTVNKFSLKNFVSSQISVIKLSKSLIKVDIKKYTNDLKFKFEETVKAL